MFVQILDVLWNHLHLFGVWEFVAPLVEHHNRQGSSGDMDQSAGFNGSMTMKDMQLSKWSENFGSRDPKMF